MLMQAKNAVGFNTPGAASSAADLETQDPPKWSAKPAKMDVEKQHVFGIDSMCCARTAALQGGNEMPM